MFCSITLLKCSSQSEAVRLPMPFLCSGLYCLIFDKEVRGKLQVTFAWISLLQPETGGTTAPFCSPARTRSGVCFAVWTDPLSPDWRILAQSTSDEHETLLPAMKMLLKFCAQPCENVLFVCIAV